MDALAGDQREFDAQVFRGLAGSQADLSGKEFSACEFIRCNFHEAVLRETRFRDCTFKHCDLSLSDVSGSVFIGVKFEDSQLVGINWTDVAWNKDKLHKPVEFVRCVLNHGTFTGLDLKKIQMLKCIAHDVDFSDANLSQAVCRSTDFNNSRFVHTNLTEADFTGAQNYTIAAGLNTLKKTKFSLPEAMSLLYSLDIELVDEEQ